MIIKNWLTLSYNIKWHHFHPFHPNLILLKTHWLCLIWKATYVWTLFEHSSSFFVESLSWIQSTNLSLFNAAYHMNSDNTIIHVINCTVYLMYFIMFHAVKNECDDTEKNCWFAQQETWSMMCNVIEQNT